MSEGGASTAVLVHVPGLQRRALDAGAWPRLRAILVRDRVADLVPSFPSHPSTVLASILSGCAPARHGVLGNSHFDSESPLSGPEAPLLLTHPPSAGAGRGILFSDVELDSGLGTVRCLADPLIAAREQADAAESRFIVAVDTGWLRAAAADGGQSARGWSELSRIDEQLVALHASGRADPLLIVGAPALHPVVCVVDSQELRDLAAAGVAILEGATARVRPAPTERDALRERLLMTQGVERVLAGESLERWGCAHAQAGELLVVAGPGYSFVKQRVATGHYAFDHHDAALVIALGGEGSPAWPPQIHDIRLGSTLARELGVVLPDARDAPVDL